MIRSYRAAGLLLLAAGTLNPLDARSAQATDAAETSCAAMVDRDGTLNTSALPDLRVLDSTAQPGSFAPHLPDGVVGIMCRRASLVPGPHDDEILALGLPFYISESKAPARLGVLEIDQGQYRFRMLEGVLDSEDDVLLSARLEEFQSRLQGQR